MQALASLGRTADAIKLGEYFIENVAISADSSKVVNALGSIIFASGEQEQAIELLESWLDANPNAAAAQITAQLLGWYDGIGDSEHLINLASRGIRDLAEEQPSAQTGNLFYRRALAHDKRALFWSDSASVEKEKVCNEIQAALLDYDMAGRLDVSSSLLSQVNIRKAILQDLASRHGCAIMKPEVTSGEMQSDTKTDFKAAVQALVVEVISIVNDKDLEASQQAEKVNSLLEARDMVVRAATVNMLSNIAVYKALSDCSIPF
jgi:tetratricopeptide (TPR) repeat protein